MTANDSLCKNKYTISPRLKGIKEVKKEVVMHGILWRNPACGGINATLLTP
jgi:hypothetical protein